MATEKDLANLLEKSIQAADRTTHAVRAFVLFLFIQLAFYTAAFVIWQIGLVFVDEDDCTILGCEPNGFVQFIVGLLVILGIVLSSRAGWQELGQSEVPGASTVLAGAVAKPKVQAPKRSFKEWLRD